MQGFEIKFNVYADSQQEADEATKAICQFISAQAQQGRAVTANKIADAVRKFGHNIIVSNYFR